MKKQIKYKFNMEEKYKQLEIIDIQEVTDQSRVEQWFNQTLCHVNDTTIRFGIGSGEFHWHKHDKEDEFFYVVEGRFLIDIDEKTIELYPKQGIVVPKGIMHRTRAPEKAVILMVEKNTVKPAGDE